jgi:hypothetical protein
MSIRSAKIPGLERPVFVLDVLMDIREEVRRGRPFWFFFGAESAEMMWAYIVGYVSCCYRNGFTDEEWGRFMDWLSDVKHEFPEGGGWVKKYLHDCGGNHGEAMMKFLDFVAEFVATQRG